MHALTVEQHEVLSDIQLFLSYLHMIQELVSAEKTPTLAIVLPLYERLIKYLTELKKDLLKLCHAIQISGMHQ